MREVREHRIENQGTLIMLHKIVEQVLARIILLIRLKAPAGRSAECRAHRNPLRVMGRPLSQDGDTIDYYLQGNIVTPIKEL